MDTEPLDTNTPSQYKPTPLTWHFQTRMEWEAGETPYNLGSETGPSCRVQRQTQKFNNQSGRKGIVCNKIQKQKAALLESNGGMLDEVTGSLNPLQF